MSWGKGLKPRFHASPSSRLPESPRIRRFAIIRYGISVILMAQRYAMKEPTTKITVHIPTALLQQARSITGEGVTGTVRRGLRQIASVHAQKELRELRGQVPISLDLEKLREDRDPDPR